MRKEDAHRTEHRCSPDSDTKGSADGWWGFFGGKATIRLHLFVCLLFVFLLSPRTTVKISFAVVLRQGDHQRCSQWQIRLPGFCIFSYKHKNKSIVDLLSHTLKDFSKCVDLFGPDEKGKLRLRRKTRTTTTTIKTVLFMKPYSLNTKIQTTGKVPYNRCPFGEIITSDR